MTAEWYRAWLGESGVVESAGAAGGLHGQPAGGNGMKIDRTRRSAGCSWSEATCSRITAASFARLYCDNELRLPATGGRAIRQINFSRTEKAGALRGLHFQKPPRAEMKLVRCLQRQRLRRRGRFAPRHSPTFLRWHATELTPDNRRMMVIPEGCAHGFQALAAGSELLYLHTAPLYAVGWKAASPGTTRRWRSTGPLPVTGCFGARRRPSPHRRIRSREIDA